MDFNAPPGEKRDEEPNRNAVGHLCPTCDSTRRLFTPARRCFPEPNNVPRVLITSLRIGAMPILAAAGATFATVTGFCFTESSRAA